MSNYSEALLQRKISEFVYKLVCVDACLEPLTISNHYAVADHLVAQHLSAPIDDWRVLNALGQSLILRHLDGRSFIEGALKLTEQGLALKLAPEHRAVLSMLHFDALETLGRRGEACAFIDDFFLQNPELMTGSSRTATNVANRYLCRFAHDGLANSEAAYEDFLTWMRMAESPAGVKFWRPGETLAGCKVRYQASGGPGDVLRQLCALIVPLSEAASVDVFADDKLREIIEAAIPNARVMKPEALSDRDGVWMHAMQGERLMHLTHSRYDWREALKRSLRYAALKQDIASRLPSDGRPRVGFAWRSRIMNPLRMRNSLGLKDLAPLLQKKGLALFSLQHDVSAAEKAWLLARRPDCVLVEDAFDMYDDFLALCATIELMDAFICPDTTTREVAGNLGKRVISLSVGPRARDRVRGTQDVFFPNTTHVFWNFDDGRAGVVKRGVAALEAALAS